MKRWVLVFATVVVLSGMAFVVTRRKVPPNVPAPPVSNPPGNRTVTEASPPPAVSETPTPPRSASRPADNDSAVSPDARPAPVVPPPATAARTDFERAMELLVSPQTGFAQKQAMLRQLKEAGKLDQVIAELKQRAADNPGSPEIQTTLGEAYLNKFPVPDYNEAAILGLQVDQSFNAALKSDPANWEAQFFKAESMSYWPPEMNKGEEVIQRLSSLIDQQEKMPPQPQFAQTYVLLGEQYRKAGKLDYAEQVWRLGAARFPSDSTLQKKINGQ